MSKIWTPPDPDDWGVVQDIQPSTRVRHLPDGRVMGESRITLTPEAMGELWAGYRCAACLERQDEAFPEFCKAEFCRFPIRAEQQRQMQLDFVGQQPPPLAGFNVEEELDILRQREHRKRPMMTVPKKIK
jgi:hypothetical protein